MIKKVLPILLILLTLSAFAQDVIRTRPAKWDSLVYGGRFADLFLPMPIIGELTSDTWGAADVRPRDVLNGIEDPAWSYWGGRPFRDETGKYNLFICRWPENHPKGHWAYHYSEIVRAVSDNPLGPYKATNLVVGKGHNPDLYPLKDGRYAIYSVGLGFRIFYYIADHLAGPWKEGELYRFDLRDRKKLRTMVNMTFARREDGSYLAMPRAGDVWMSKDGISTFERVSNGSTHPPQEGKYEDPVIWKDHVQYHKIVNDWYGRIAYYQRSLDGIHWVEEPGEAYFPGISKYEDGTQTNWYKYERIRMLQDEYGRAVQANFAVIDTSKHADFPSDNHNSKNIAIPLVKGRLMEVLNPGRIDENTSEIILKIKAEADFNPQEDMDLKSLRLGASEIINYGGGCRVKSTKKDGNDLVLTFVGNHGLKPENFALKLLGREKDGSLLFGWARLPGIDYLPPILSARKPFVPENNRQVVQFEVKNYGLSESQTQTVVFELLKDGKSTRLKGEIPSLDPYETTLVRLENTAALSKESKGKIKVYLESCPGKPLYEQNTLLDLQQPGNQIFEEAGTTLKEEAVLKKGQVNSRMTKGKYSIGYHVYMPQSFNPKKLPPIVIAFNPSGKGKEIAGKIYEGVKDLGWIVVGCDSLKNNMKDEKLELEIEDVLLNDILKTVPHDNQRVYLAGFSGGAMRAYGISARRSEKFAGIIAYGGWLGGNDYQNLPYPAGMAVAMINGENDKGANHWIDIDTATLQKRGCVVKHFSHPGGHKVAPAEITRQAAEWLSKRTNGRIGNGGTNEHRSQ